MNRRTAGPCGGYVSVPHASGDEPVVLPALFEMGYAFPTRVGMNRLHGAFTRSHQSVPHASGDEPEKALIELLALERSPREWG